MRKNLTSAIIASFIVYLDIVLKIIFSLTNNVHAQGDYYWLAILILIALLLLFLCYFKDSFILQLLTLCVSGIPVIIAIIYFCTFHPLNENSDWALVLTYMISELILLVPIYVFQTMKIWKMYHLKE